MICEYYVFDIDQLRRHHIIMYETSDIRFNAIIFGMVSIAIPAWSSVFFTGAAGVEQQSGMVQVKVN